MEDEIYDENGNLTETVTGLTSAGGTGDVTTYAYDDADRLVRRDEPGPGWVDYAYDDDGRRIGVTDEAGGTREYLHDSRGRVVRITDPLGLPTDHAYDAASWLIRTRQPEAPCDITVGGEGCTTYAYDAAGQLTGVDYTDGVTPDVTAITYDRLGRRTAATVAGVTETWAWDARSRLTSRADANGRTTLYGWDPASNLTSIRYPGQTTPLTRAYDDAGQLVSVTDWTGRVSTFDYDANGNWTDTVFPTASGNTDVRSYDESDRLVGVEWNRGASTLGALTYDPRDAKGRVTEATGTGAVAGIDSEWAYDARDRMTGHNSDSYGYDDVDNLVEQPDGTLQVFDPAQRLCWSSPTAAAGSCVAPAADATVFDYDARGNRTGMTRPDGTAVSYGFDQADRMVSVVDAGPAPISERTGVPLSGDFDGDGADDVLWYAPGTADDWVTWGATRGTFGRSASSYVVNGTYVPVAADFNGDGHEDVFWYGPGATGDSVWFWFNTGTGDYTTRSFTVGGDYRPVAGDFDADGFGDVYWYSPGAAADYLWWGNAGVDDTAAFTSTGVSRGADFRPVAGDFDGNGADDIFWYEPGAGADTVWFGTGTRNSWAARAQSVSGSYSLVAGDLDGDGRDDVVFYNPGGNDTVWWGAHANDFGPTGETPVTLGAGLWPAAGDFDGDGRDDLLVYAPAGPDTVWWGTTTRADLGTFWHTGLPTDPVTATYAYDATGLRRAKTVNGTGYQYTWDVAGGLPLLLSEQRGASVSHLVYGPGGTAIYQITATGTPIYLHQDHQGSTRLVTNPDGTTRGTLTYSAYGQITSNTIPPLAEQPLAGYTSEYTDTETGYIYLRARYLDPESGQFTTQDPLVTATEAPYAYAANNPVNATDPLGLWPSWDDVKRATGAAVNVAKDVGGRAVDVTVATMNAPVTATTAAVNSWTGGDCDWAKSLTVVCYGGLLSRQTPGAAYVTGSTINTTVTKKEYRDANAGNLHRHETWHTRQWALFGGGPIFPALYGLETLRTGGDECQNVFEIWAGLEDGGYK